MRIAMTLMVRDEADVIDAMLRHHADQGIDVFIVTDNGSTDGTVEALETFARDHDVDLRHDPVHHKQQSTLVTGMARDAASRHGADWVLNADADEFWVPSGNEDLRSALAEVPSEIGAFQIPVIDMTGEPAQSGTGLGRLVWRDLRPQHALAAAGLRAHSSPDAVHRGDPDIVVAQGNHEVNRPSGQLPGTGSGIEVLHLPWRSWAQFRRKVENSGRSYLANPELQPSPNHHGMRDYGRLLEGSLLAAYVARHPSPAELLEGEPAGWFVREDRLAVSSLPTTPDVALDGLDQLRAQGRALVQRESRMLEERDEARAEVANLLGRIGHLEESIAAQERAMSELRNRKVVRLSDRLSRVARRQQG